MCSNLDPNLDRDVVNPRADATTTHSDAKYDLSRVSESLKTRVLLAVIADASDLPCLSYGYGDCLEITLRDQALVPAAAPPAPPPVDFVDLRDIFIRVIAQGLSTTPGLKAALAELSAAGGDPYAMSEDTLRAVWDGALSRNFVFNNDAYEAARATRRVG